jgi:phosphoglycolate phosphatase
MVATTNRLSRAWDEFDAYLFDIDGTLLNCRDAVHYFAFCDALTSVAGRPMNLDGVVCHGNVDAGILRDAFVRAGVEEQVWRGELKRICEGIGAQVEANAGQMEIDVLPGAGRVLEHLRARGAVLSTATGNLARVGIAKLGRCGLLEHFQHGGWSDGCESRDEVFRKALAGLREALGTEATVCVVGDTPADVRSAHANGLEVIAVATGIYSGEELEAAGPELLVPSLLALFA